MKKFIVGRIISFKFAFKGAFIVLKSEHAIITQIIIALLTIVLGFYFEINQVEWMFLVFAIGLILVAETLNTAIEKICDFIHPEHHNKIGLIKDIAAGAVFFAALTSILIGIFIFYPYLKVI